MSFKFEIKEEALLMRFGGDEFTESDARELDELLLKYPNVESIVDLRVPEVIDAAGQLEEIQYKRREEHAAMVYLLRPAHLYLFSEDCDTAESHQEARDILKEYEDGE